MEGLIPIAMAVAWMTLYPSSMSFSRMGRAGLTQSFVTLRSQSSLILRSYKHAGLSVGGADLSSQSPVVLCRSSSVDVPRSVTEYTVKQASWSTQSSRYQNIWDWVYRTVEPAILAPYLELLVSQERLSLQNVIRALRNKFQPSEDNTREQVRKDYKRILYYNKIGSINPKVWINNWYQVLARAQTYYIPEVEGFLAIKDFLQAFTLVVEANALGEPVRILEQYGKIFEALIQETVRTRNVIFVTLGGRSSSPSGHYCPYKETRTERYSWTPSDCSILELAVKGKTAKTPDPLLTDKELKAIRERLMLKQYEKVRGILEKKG
ncbi:hypothetical protein NA56DRAFT_712717 [Hyaloscypha hepaticicola]|uniref:Uncharacterized protein n=1 Tax=Hyaloscypha hepaticicola TaxID=2082293 RepID=A0A2J6PFF0_9HELO|nr:hypothetical protein NA56DRAFT_712717 [Hyaloscypha hepaticicola]